MAANNHEALEALNKEEGTVKGEKKKRTAIEIERMEKGKKNYYIEILVIDGDTISGLGARLKRSYKESVKYYKMCINAPARDGGSEGSVRSNDNSVDEHHIYPGNYFYIPCHMTHPVKKQKKVVKLHGEVANFSMDCHMHIQSGNCAPLPLLWPKITYVHAIVKATEWKRSTMNSAGLKFAKAITEPSMKETLELGHNVAKLNKEYYKRHFINNSDSLTPMIVMPMDMDLGHLDGYWGEPVYYGVDYKIVATYFDKETEEIIEKELFPPILKYYNMQERRFYTDNEKKKAEEEMVKEYQKNGYDISKKTLEKGKYYYYLDYDGINDRSRPDWEPSWLDDEEAGFYEPYKKQIFETEKASIIHPFKIIPLFHYDPRRYQEPNLYFSESLISDRLTENWDIPFENVATERTTGNFAGFKMYNSLGYKPADYMRLKNQKKFYKRCEENQIPIMAHCTPKGMFNEERKLYWDYVTNDERKEPYEGFFTDDKINYFSDSYVSPMAWEKVLKEFPKLRLCLAHFMGLEWEVWTKWTNSKIYHHKRKNQNLNKSDIDRFRQDKLKEWFENQDNGRWIKKCLQLLVTYENVYTDISYFILKDNYHAFEWLLKNYQGYWIIDENGIPMITPPKYDENLSYFNQHLRNKILFGTDWYVLEADFHGYGKYVESTKKYLDLIDPGDPKKNIKSIWDDFSSTNPLSFYRLDKILDNYKEGLLKRNKEIGSKTNYYINPMNGDEKKIWDSNNFSKPIDYEFIKMKKYFVYLEDQSETRRKNE